MKLTEREKSYHDGYEQGRFDEYAERMGYDQAEKVKAKIDKQKNCPYCHAGSNLKSQYNGSVWNDDELNIDYIDDKTDKIDNRGKNMYADLIFNPRLKYLQSWAEGTDPLTVEISYCPFCGRKL